MSVHPQLIDKPGTIQGNTRAIADLNRKVRRLIARDSLHPQSVKGSNIDNATVTGDNLAPSTVTADNIVSGTITSNEIAVGTITATNIVAGTITANEIAAGTITATQIAAGTITAGNIHAGTITATQIAAATITATQIASATITGSNIAGATITGANIASNTVTAGNINVANLSAISANLGTVTGGIFQTAATGARVMMGTGLSGVGITQGIVGINIFGAQTFSIDAATGNVILTGTLTAQAGSAIPVSTTTGYLPGSANRYSVSSFQDGAGAFSTTGWSSSAATLSDGGTTVPPIYGSHTLKVVATGTAPFIFETATTDTALRVVPGLPYTFSHFVYPTTSATNARVDVQWFDSTGTQIGSNVAGVSTPTVLNTWTRIITTLTAPAGAAFARGIHFSSVAATVGDVAYVQCFQMEQSDRESSWAARPDEILFNSISALQIQAGTITTTQIAATTITSANIAAGTITTTNIAANAITSSLIAANTITGSDIAANTITGTNIAANTIAASNIVSNTITSTQLNATAIDAMTITGATFRANTNGSISNVTMDSTGIKGYNSSGTNTFWLATNGVLLASSGTFSGSISGASGTIGGITFNSSGISSTYFNLNTQGQFTADMAVGLLTSGSLPSPHLQVGAAGSVGTLYVDSSRSFAINAGTAANLVFQTSGTTQMIMDSNDLTLTDGLNIKVGTSVGTMIGLASSSKIAFFGQTPITQPSGTAAGGFNNGGGLGVNIGFTSNGSIGSTNYSFNDIVHHLKALGAIAS